MHTRVFFAAIVLNLVLGCGTAPPEVSEPAASTNDPAASAVVEQQQAIAKLQDELTTLKNSFKMMEQLQALKSDQTEKQLRELNEKLDQVTKRLDKLPIEVQLQMRFPGRIKGTLEEAVAELSEWTKIPMHFEIGDLGEAGIPKIHEVELTGGDVSVAQLLGDALCQSNLYRVNSLADPQLVVVYVIQNAGRLGNESLLITSRKRAKERGKLPAAFVAKK